MWNLDQSAPLRPLNDIHTALRNRGRSPAGVAAGCVVFLLLAVLASPVEAQRKGSRRKGEKPETSTSGPRDYKSNNFLMHTDLPEKDAQDLLERLEKMLTLISRYWGQPNRQTIECFVVQDLAKWPSGALHPEGVISIRGRAGITISQKVSIGNRFRATAVVYAVADRGTPQHEAVHAYCAQTFGNTGPVWYSEGMAEMGQYWKDGDFSVNADDVVIRYLRSAETKKTLSAIVDRNEQTGDSWQNYAWRWALCHLLANNENYRKRFHPLGLGLLTEQRGMTFQQVYGSMSREINFEYLFFLNHVERGFRADLCSWDWKARYRVPRGRSGLLSRIVADHGWQPSRLKVRSGEQYAYSASGTWKLDAEADPVNADGTDDGSGQLVAAIFNDEDYTLGEEFPLGRYGSFTASADGNLVLRCRDAWGRLADNAGRMTVRLKSFDEKSPLPEPKDD